MCNCLLLVYLVETLVEFDFFIYSRNIEASSAQRDTTSINFQQSILSLGVLGLPCLLISEDIRCFSMFSPGLCFDPTVLWEPRAIATRAVGFWSVSWRWAHGFGGHPRITPRCSPRSEIGGWRAPGWSHHEAKKGRRFWDNWYDLVDQERMIRMKDIWW